MKTTEPFRHVEHGHAHNLLLNHPEPPPAAVRKRLFIRAPFSITLLFILSILLVILNQQVLATNSALLEKYSRKHSQADRLKWQRTAFHFQPAKNFIYGIVKLPHQIFVFFFSILIVFFFLVYFMAIDNILGWTLLQILILMVCLLFHMGWYHLFYQHTPYASVWENMSWGHAVSKDLINWFELPVALSPSE
ncbi:putative 2,1-fructan:2,1-fructan 1-fructosyltransferase [Helianthus annuus]|nr:putative 2,1-fructan:2,1-fructan 1-fructosyltransferase [Helianthus annuus]